MTMGFAVAIAVAFLVIAAGYQQQGLAETNEKLVQRVGNQIQQELIVASGVRDGYRRSVSLPEQVGGRPYSISGSGTLVTIRSGDALATVRVPEFSGSWSPGDNVVLKEDGELIVT